MLLREYMFSFSKLFPFRVDPFSEGTCSARKQNETTKVVSLIEKCGKLYQDDFNICNNTITHSFTALKLY